MSSDNKLREKLANTRMEHVTRKSDRRKKEKKSTFNLELIGGVFFIEKFEDGTERREEIDGEAILALVKLAIEKSVAEK